MFDAKTYADRRGALAKHLPSGLILLPGNDASPANFADNPFPFRQDSTFLYYFGLDEPGLAAVIDIDENQEILFGDDPGLDEIVWTGPQPSVQEKAAAIGVAKTAAQGELADFIAKARAGGREIHFLPPYRPEHFLSLSRLLDLPPEQIQSHASEQLIRAVVAQRSVKSEEEVAEIEAALEISHAMHVAAMRRSQSGRYEWEVAGAVEGIALAAGVRPAFPVIFTVRGQTLHIRSHEQRMQDGDLVIHDSGAESKMHYASDITRTFPVSGTFDSRQRDIYEIVRAAQEEAISAVRPGVRYLDVHLDACRAIARGLHQLGLMQGDAEAAVQAGAHALFLPHGLGHMLGLDVHDMENLGEDFVGYDDKTQRSGQFGLRALRLARELQPGFALTVEPGIYFIPELIDRWQAEKKFTEFINYEKVAAFRDFTGVRIEDTVLVTATGARVPGPPIPKSVTEIEKTMEAR